MDLKEDDNVNDTGRLYLVGNPRDPLVSAGAIVATCVADDINPTMDLQSSALAGLMGAQSSSVCFPAKFSKWTLRHPGSDLINSHSLPFSLQVGVVLN